VKKLAKKCKKRHALEGLNDHGGKAGGGGRVVAVPAAVTAARATVRTLTRVAIMVVEVGGVKGA
jgi:hypothetical protein